MSPSPPPDLQVGDSVVDERRRRAEHLRSLGDLYVVQQLEKVAGWIDCSRAIRREGDAVLAEHLLEHAHAAALSLLGIRASS